MEIERTRRPFWIHQVVEYLIGIGLISASVQLPDPAVPALLGLLVIVNAAVAKGSAGAFRLVGHRVHRSLDLVVIGVLVVFAVQPWVSIDNTGRLLIGGIAFIMWFVWFHTDFSERPSRAERSAARRASGASQGPRGSEDIGRQAGRVVGAAGSSVKRWKDSFTTEAEDQAPTVEARPPNWDPPSPPRG